MTLSPLFSERRRRALSRLAVAIGLMILLAVGWVVQSGRSSSALASPALQGPSQPPSARNGQAIYQESCAPCHGVSGGGDGATASQLPNGAAVLADPMLARRATPDGWFDVVKNGRMDRFMPPWKNRLSDEQIWDAVAYALTLSTSEGEIARGQAIWGENCAACHGDSGAGDGPEAIANNWQITDLSDPALSAGQSLDAWHDVTVAGRGDMPAFQDKLPEADIWAALDYARTFSFQPLAAPAVPAGKGRLLGKVTNGTPGGGSVSGLTVTLNTFEEFNPLATKETQVAADGSFEFTDLPTDPKYVYLVNTEYAGMGFGSDISGFAEGQTELQLPVSVYETSDQPGDIRANLAQWFLQPHQGGVLVGELYRITQTGDRVYIGGEQVAPGKRSVLSFDLPPEATSLVVDGGEIGDRFVLTEDGVVDTMPMAPGGRQILMRYLLPYTGTKAKLAHALSYPVDKLSVLVADGPTVQTELQDQGQQTVNEEQWNSFGADNLPAGEEISLRLTDLERATAAEVNAPGAPAMSAMVLSYNPRLLVGVAVLSLIVAGLILAAYLLRKPPPAAEPPPSSRLLEPQSVEELTAERQQLLESIAQLDDRYAAGELDQERYQSLRAAQKRSLLLASQRLTAQSHSTPAPAQAADSPEQATA